MSKNEPKPLCICGHTIDKHKDIGDPDVVGGCRACGCSEFKDIREHKSKMDRSGER